MVGSVERVGIDLIAVSVDMIVKSECRDGYADRVGTDPEDGSIDMMVDMKCRDGANSLMNLSLCGSLHKISVSPSRISMTIIMSFTYG